MITDIYNDIGKIIGFLIGIALLNAIAGQKMTVYFLVLVLIGQVIMNPSILKKIPFFGGKT
jgi:hypothetical protein